MKALIIAAILLLTACGGTKMETVVIETNLGTIEVELDRAHAPITVQNFVTYVNEGYYDGTIFHRVMPDFMVQGGGFTPEGEQKQTHAPIKLEAGNSLSNMRGTIAMARTMVKDSATSQFFINVVDNKMLDKNPKSDGYAVFGKVTKGMDVVDRIRVVETESRGPHDDWPVEDVVIVKAYMKT
jgi:peptidyl-prolyl cis-trans isomerase A (cyclophilin A)